MGSLFAVVGIGAGAYCLYAYFMMRTKREINKTVLLPKDVDVKKCKDIDGYIKDTSLPLLILAISVLTYGLAEAVNEYVRNVGSLLFIILALVAIVLIWFAVVVKKANKKYFGV